MQGLLNSHTYAGPQLLDFYLLCELLEVLSFPGGFFRIPLLGLGFEVTIHDKSNDDSLPHHTTTFPAREPRYPQEERGRIRDLQSSRDPHLRCCVINCLKHPVQVSYPAPGDSTRKVKFQQSLAAASYQ
jgi:hypothetical protein